MNVTVYYPCWDVLQCPSKEIVFECEMDQYSYPEVLEYLFDGFGNHPYEGHHNSYWRAAKTRSMSSGDIVSFDDLIFFQCAATGWIQITKDRLQEVMAMRPYNYWNDKNLWSSQRIDNKF